MNEAQVLEEFFSYLQENTKNVLQGAVNYAIKSDVPIDMALSVIWKLTAKDAIISQDPIYRIN